MPTPQAGESRDDFVSRCIPEVLDKGTAETQDQAVAICNSMWEDKDMHEDDEDKSLEWADKVKKASREVNSAWEDLISSVGDMNDHKNG